MAHWLIFGASGLLGSALCPMLAERDETVFAAYSRHTPKTGGVEARACDLMQPGAGANLVRALRPDAVVYAAGLTSVDQCESDEAHAMRLHCDAAAECLGAADTLGSAAIYVSTDHLWRGDATLVGEDTPCEPINAYARTKFAGERAVREISDRTLIVRTNFFGWGPPWRQSLSDWILNELAAGRTVDAFRDAYFTPIESTLLAGLIYDLAQAGATGVIHAAGSERLSKFDFALKLAQAFGYPTDRIKPSSIHDHGFAARRPADMSLATDRIKNLLGKPMPDADLSIMSLKQTAAAAHARSTGNAKSSRREKWHRPNTT